MVATRKNRRPPSHIPETPPNSCRNWIRHWPGWEVAVLEAGSTVGMQTGEAMRRLITWNGIWTLNFANPSLVILNLRAFLFALLMLTFLANFLQMHQTLSYKKTNLRKHIRENLKCKKCALTLQHQGNPAFLSFLEIVWCKPITLWGICFIFFCWVIGYLGLWYSFGIIRK